MNMSILTLFPEVIESYINASIIKRAQESEIVKIDVINFRDFSSNKHHSVDDSPFGGGAGMVISPQPVADALKSIEGLNKKVIYLTPKGKLFNHFLAKELSNEEHIVLICGHYEGLDQRIIDEYVDEEISIGDYVLSGGEVGAMAILDAVTRLLPGALNDDSLEEESFTNYLLEYPHYTRPRVFEDVEIPEVLLSGHHKNIELYRKTESIRLTLKRRPDLIEEGIEKKRFSKEILKLIVQEKKNLY